MIGDDNVTCTGDDLNLFDFFLDEIENHLVRPVSVQRTNYPKAPGKFAENAWVISTKGNNVVLIAIDKLILTVYDYDDNRGNDYPTEIFSYDISAPDCTPAKIADIVNVPLRRVAAENNYVIYEGYQRLGG